jgi:hypothetical protein
MTASIFVTPGGAASIDDASAELVLTSLTGNPTVERDGPNVTIRNSGDDQVLVRIAMIQRAAPP